MLANGAKLGFKKKGGSTFTDLLGLTEIPEMGIEPEKVDMTCLTSANKEYENGIGDVGDLEYKFLFANDSATSPYRVMRAAQATNEVLEFQETLIDGTVTTFTGQPNVKRTGGGVNGRLEFSLKITLRGKPEVKDPAAGA